MSSDYVSPWWQASLLPDKWDVCGIVVHALSNWHRYALDQLKNPYVCGGIHDRNAAASLLMICARDKAELRALYLRPHARAKALAAIHKTIEPLDGDRLDFACMDYVKSCLRAPLHHDPVKTPGSGQSFRLLAAPAEFCVVLCLTDHWGFDLDPAWNHPYAISRCMYDAYQETEKGDDTLSSEDQMRRKDEWIKKHGEREL